MTYRNVRGKHDIFISFVFFSFSKVSSPFTLCLRWNRLNFTLTYTSLYSLMTRKYPGVFRLYYSGSHGLESTEFYADVH